MNRDEVSTGQQGIRRSQADELPPREPPLYARAPAPHPTAPASSPAERRGLIEYRCAQPNDPRLSRLDIFDPAATAVAARALAEIVEVEAPISEDLALRRLAEWFGAQRITDRFRARFREVCTAALRAHAINRDGGLFWAKASDPADFKSFRIPGADDATRRDLEDVPLVERINAVVHVLWEQVALPPEELERETARLLGIQRVTSRSRQPIAEAVEAAITRGHAECRDGRICAAPS